MKALVTATVLAVGLDLAAPAMADDEGHCSIQSIAGRWMFVTEVGQFPAGGAISPPWER